jgi:predicted ester cyclase
MSDANVDVVRRLEEAWAGYDYDTVRDILGSGWKEHAEHLGGKADLDFIIQNQEGARGAFPDAVRTIEDIFGEDDLVVARVRLRATNTGGLPWFGIPANDNKVDVEWINIYRVAGGNVVDHWAEMDVAGLMQQLGAAPGM